MKIKIKNFVFAGFAAAMFAGNAMANEGDLDPTVNPTHVTAKSYVDRVVTNATANVAGKVDTNQGVDNVNKYLQVNASGNLELQSMDQAPTESSNKAVTSGAVYTALAGKQDNLIVDTEPTSGSAAYVTSGTVYTALAGKQNKSDSTVANGTYNYIQQGSGVATNLIGLDTQVKANADDIDALQTSVAGLSNYDDTALAGRVTTIENSAAYNSGITSAKVTQYDNYATNKQDKADSTVAANGNYIVAGSDVKTNLGNLDTQVKANADAIATKASSSDLTTLAGRVTTAEGDIDALETAVGNLHNYDDTALAARVTTAEGDIDALESGKQDKSASTVANNGNYIISGNGVATNLVNLDTQVKSNADAIATKASSSDLTTLAGRVTTAESNISLKQNEADSNVAQAGNYIAAGHGVASNLTALDTRAKTNADNISTNTTNIGTLNSLTTSNKTNLVSAINEVNTAATNAATAGQPKSNDNLLAGTLNGNWVSIDAEDETANTCDSTHPCVWVNNVWTPIQQ